MITTPLLNLGMSLVESERMYRPDSIARRIVNLGPIEEEPLALGNLGQLTLQDPKAGSFSTRIDGMIHVDLFDGANQCTLVRSNTTIKRHQGWTRSYETVATGISYDPNQPYPDVMLQCNGRVIWSNGIDRPLVIDVRGTSGRLVTPLGFDMVPSRPKVRGPSQKKGEVIDPTSNDPMPLPPNYEGYVAFGSIGSVSQMNGEDGNLLDGAWYYFVQFEDVHGNLSPLSPASQPVTLMQASAGYLNPQSADYTRMNSLDSLTRQFVVSTNDVGEEHVAAVRLYRTQDTKHNGNTAYLLSRITGRQKFTYPDNVSDAQLVAGELAEEYAVCPLFKVGCIHDGRLIAANTSTDPSKVWWSEPGAVGTFRATSWAVPDQNGSITAVASHAGYLWVFTASRLYRLELSEEGVTITPASTALGCLAPQSVCELADGSLVWLSQRGFVRMSGGSIASISDNIGDMMMGLSRGRAGRAVAAVDPRSGCYLAAIPTQERGWNDRWVVFDPQYNGWREINQGFYPSVFARMDNRAGDLLIAGLVSGATYGVFVWDSPSPRTTVYPEAAWESGVLQVDPQGETLFTVREIHIGFIETDTNPTLSASLTWYTPKRPKPDTKSQTFSLVGNDYDRTYVVSSLLLDDPDHTYVRGMVRWRKVQLAGLRDVPSFRFKVTFPVAQRVRLVGFQFVLDVGGRNGSRTSGPTRN